MPTGKIAITGFISDLFMLHYNRHKPDDLSSCVEIYFPIDVTAKRRPLANYKRGQNMNLCLPALKIRS